MKEIIDKSFSETIEKHLKGDVGRPLADIHLYEDYFSWQKFIIGRAQEPFQGKRARFAKDFLS